MGHPLNRETVLAYAQQITGRDAAPGKSWLRRFLKRHKAEIRYCPTMGLDPKRALAFNYAIVRDHFEKLREVIEKYNIPPENIFNMDEKGCQLGGGRKVKRQKYLFGRESQAHYRIRSASLELVTVVECVCADGTALPPYIIFKAQRSQKEWLNARGANRAGV